VFSERDAGRLQALCGPHHRHLHRLDLALEAFGLHSESQGGGISLSGGAEGVAWAERALAAFRRRIDAGLAATDDQLDAALAETERKQESGFAGIRGLKKPVLAQTRGQEVYVRTLMEAHPLTFGVGPAGTGKTFLAVAAGVGELLSGERERLVVARPAVEAGEKLGFLPGDMKDKVDPYMLPIWDSLSELMGTQEMERRRERREIEVAPLAFMRGRTLKNAFVIIDEAQNATVAQMKMLLTRLGRNARMVVTGDPSQVDLPGHQTSGLAHALRLLDGMPGVAQVRLGAADVVRHELVARIVDAYADDEAARHAAADS
jgi:phosphate starvation-inducible PhoH-like protein